MPTLDLSNVKGPSKLDTLSILSQMPGLLNWHSAGLGLGDGLLMISQNLGLFSGQPRGSLEDPSKELSDRPMPPQDRITNSVKIYRTNFFMILPPSQSVYGYCVNIKSMTQFINRATETNVTSFPKAQNRVFT